MAFVVLYSISTDSTDANETRLSSPHRDCISHRPYRTLRVQMERKQVCTPRHFVHHAPAQTPIESTASRGSAAQVTVEASGVGGDHDRPDFIILAVGAAGALVSAAGFLVEEDWLIVPGLCFLLGFLVKLIDQFIDEHGGREKRAILAISLAIPLIMGYMALRYSPVFGMVMGAGFGLLLAGKMDHPGYIVSLTGFMVFIAAAVHLLGGEISRESMFIAPVAFAGSFSDEYIHEKTPGTMGRVHDVFEHRPALKAAAFVCTAIGWAEWVHFVGFICFDIAYDLVAWLWRDKRGG